MKSFIKGMDGLALWIKIILALPILDIVWNVYRLARSIDKGSVLGIVLGILLIIIGIPFMWLVDIISLIVANKILWID